MLYAVGSTRQKVAHRCIAPAPMHEHPGRTYSLIVVRRLMRVLSTATDKLHSYQSVFTQHLVQHNTTTTYMHHCSGHL